MTVFHCKLFSVIYNLGLLWCNCTSTCTGRHFADKIQFSSSLRVRLHPDPYCSHVILIEIILKYLPFSKIIIKLRFDRNKIICFWDFNPYLRVMWHHKNHFVSQSRVTHSSHLYYGRAFWLVLGHCFPVNSLRTLRIVVVQVRDIYRDRCDGL